ncbi:homeobox protein Mohawk-like [Cololabis saira]|uniref:homeobox protein Mohawk-like n=1 Tax=Cololabis saira TaxID=129043 RepID=UPI002AD4AAEE|nr:homeobox protein Mohawk-like [Cololabis saira]
MDEVAVMKSDTLLRLDGGGRAEQGSRATCADFPQTSLTGRDDADLLQCQDDTENSSALKYRRYGSRLSGVKIRHKRQVLQDMARPLKHWLYKHRDNPYPTKTEKVLLALGSHMTLVQVSNWFANARRRLKNTVRQPDLSWALRIKLYNKYIQGNAERLSVCSDDPDSDDEECTLQSPIGQANFGRTSSHKSEGQGGMLTIAECANGDDNASPPSKYKSSLLNRYLNDTLRHMMAAKADGMASACKRRSHSESFSSNEGDRDVVSPASSYETEANFIYRMDKVDCSPAESDRGQQRSRGPPGPRGPQGWREIHAAVALTSLAQGQTCAAVCSRDPAAGAATGRSCTRGPFFSAAGPGAAFTEGAGASLRPATGTALTNRIIQKSCHISEVQTVQVALANTG